MDRKFEDIKEQLDIIISLMIPPFSKDKYNLREGTQMEVLKLCDLNYTSQDMTNKLKKTQKAIDMALDKLKSKNLIRTVKRNNKNIYLRVK